MTLTCSPKAELRRAQLNVIGRMHMKGASGSRQTAMNDPGAQQPSQMFLTWVKARPQHHNYLILKGFTFLVVGTVKIRVRFFKKIQDWILKSERIRK